MRRSRPIAWFLLLAACAHSTPKNEPVEAALAADAELLYTLERIEDPFPMVRIAVQTRGATDGTTTFTFGDGCDDEDGRLGDAVHGFAARGAQNQPLTFTRPGPRQWAIAHAPSAPLEISYFLVPSRNLRLDADALRCRPAASDHLLHLVGRGALLIPDHLDVEPRRIEVQWRGFEQAGWKVATSLGLDSRGFRIDRPVEALRGALFLAGDLRLYTRDVRGSPVHVALGAGSRAFTDHEAIELATRLIEAQRGLFSDFAQPALLLSLVEAAPGPGEAERAVGVSLTDAFELALAPGQPLAGAVPGGPRFSLAQGLLRHWIGGVIRVPGEEWRGRWFIEGFGAFYARRLLYRAGQLSLEDYIANLNATLEAYLTHPAREAPLERAAGAVEDPALRQVLALRGEAVALLVDAQIRRVTDGERSLDTLMGELFERATEGHQTFDTEELLFAVERYTSRLFALRIQQIVERGSIPGFPSNLLAPCLSMHLAPRGAWELGFDLEASQATRVITGVKQGSRAYQAGLRDGQRLATWKITPGAMDEPVSITVIEEGRSRSIFYVPIASGLPVPEFTVGPQPGECAERL